MISNINNKELSTGSVVHFFDNVNSTLPPTFSPDHPKGGEVYMYVCSQSYIYRTLIDKLAEFKIIADNVYCVVEEV